MTSSPGHRAPSPASRTKYVLLLAAAAVLGGCHVTSTKTKVPAGEIRPLLDSTKEGLEARYEELSRSVRTVNAKVTMSPHTGSRYSGVIEDYKEVSGFILAESPSHIRMIGQAPVIGSRIFDMVSDGETFKISIPPKGKFIEGPAHFEHVSKKPLENLRPQHILEVILWPPLEAGSLVLFDEEEEGTGRYYTLTEVSRGEHPAARRRIWFDRTDLNLTRIERYEPDGRLESVANYGDWQKAGEGASYPREITVERPHDDYRLGLRVTTLKLNEELPEKSFELAQPPGSELVRVGEKTAGGPQEP
ncbi:MAG TPA: hypothetical protein VLW54_11420 [Candidatus Acidoferrales bacterium]|nr:hypothetical protein [Candidatus Acidoferrales bacterium]